MTSIILNSISGLTYPYDVYVCDVYGNNCGYIAQINTNVPSPLEIVLPIPFNFAPAVGIKIITSDGCVRFRVFNCSLPISKQFQDYEVFDFMDGIEYDFQN
jgi:hypothetical protein